MKVLILEDDEVMADLLGTVVDGLYAGTNLQLAGRLSDALNHWRSDPADLVIADWNLPDGSGLTLVKEIRKTSRETPVVIISGRSDRDSILAAANLGINGYISKPFSVELVHERLMKLVDPSSVVAGDLQTLMDRMRHAAESTLQLPGLAGAADFMALAQRKDEISSIELAERCRSEAALTAKLLEVANRQSLKRSGNAVNNLKDAITAIGVPMSINQALALSMDVAGQLPDSRLKKLAVHYQTLASDLAKEAQALAKQLGGNGEMHYTAGLLSRIGELVAVRIVQQHLDAGNTVPDSEITQAIDQWASALGNRVKIQWRLSLDLRELIGAVHLLRKESVARDLLIMRAAALRVAGEGESDACWRLLRQLGLENLEKYNNGSE